MLTAADARKQLEAVAANDYAPPSDVAAAAFAYEILPHLGSPDGELRERYVYGTLHRWIVRRTLDEVAIRDLATTLLDREHLFLDIGATEGDGVFMRAFSVLLVAPIVHAHREDPFLARSDVGRIVAKTIEYLDAERDLRGYVSAAHWWAHGVAHAADVLRQLAACDDVSPDELTSMLESIARVALTDSTAFVFEEDARLAAAAIEILKRPELDPGRVAGWFATLVPEARWTGDLPRVHHRYLNARNTLRCLYFQGRAAKLPTAITDRIEAAIASLPER